jgi:hypothetical protein
MRPGAEGRWVTAGGLAGGSVSESWGNFGENTGRQKKKKKPPLHSTSPALLKYPMGPRRWESMISI